MAAPLSQVELGRIFWLRTDKANLKGYCPVSLRLTLRGHRSVEVSTGVRCRPVDWAGPQGKSGPLKKSHPEHATDSQTLETFRLNVKIAAKRLEALDLTVTPATVGQLLKNPAALTQQPDPCLLAFMEAELETNYVLGNRGTYESTRANIRKLRSWHGTKPLPLKAFGPERAQAFYRELIQAKARGGEIRSANKAIAILTGLFRRGVKQLKWTEAENPFACLTKKAPTRTGKVRLTPTEHQAIVALELDPISGPWRARAAYLVQFYLRGERIGACLLLRWSDLYQEGTRLQYQAQKNGPFKQVHIRPELAHLLAQLRMYYPKSAYILPFLPASYPRLNPQNQLNAIQLGTEHINGCLDELTRLAGIDKKIRTHSVRHTFATIAAKQAGVQAVKQMLGHTSTRVTEVYLGELEQDDLDSAADKVFDSL